MGYSGKWHILILFLTASVVSACAQKQAEPVSHEGLNACLSDPAVCNETDLCRLAIFEEDGVKRWYSDNLRWERYVAEAKARGLGCGMD